MGVAAQMPDGNHGLHSETGPLIGLRLAASPRFWRLGPAWAVFAGALAGDVPLLNGTALLRLAGAVVLADSIWGAVWVPVTNGAGSGVTNSDNGWSLPYLRHNSPAATLRALVPGATWHELLAGSALTAGLALLLGLPALVVSLCVLLVTLWALFLRHWAIEPALPRALLNVGLPWALGLAIAGDVLPDLSSLVQSGLWLGVAFTLLEWGAQRARSGEYSRGRGIWVGQAAVVGVLIALKLPWTAAATAVLFLVPSLLCLHWQSLPSHMRSRWRFECLARCAPWWWAVLLLSALAMR